jgi:hypothetical protein
VTRRRWLVVTTGLVLLPILILYLTTGRTNGIKVDGPLVAHDRGWLVLEGSGSDALVGGELRIEDGCLLLSGDAALWPDDTSWDEEANEVILEDGQRVSAGDSVRGGGGMAAEAGEPDSRRREWQESDLGRAVGSCLADDAAVVVFNYDSKIKVAR